MELDFEPLDFAQLDFERLDFEDFDWAQFSLAFEFLNSFSDFFEFSCSSNCFCDPASGPSFNATVYPFILRANHLVGIDSAQTPILIKSEIWNKFASEWYIDEIDNLYKLVSIDEIVPEIEKILNGEQVGRVILSHK